MKQEKGIPGALLTGDIAAAAEATGWVTVDTFRSLTHICGTRNKHLAELDGFDGAAANRYERATPLPLDAEVLGQFLTFDYCGHGTWASIQDHESLADVERFMLSAEGILNPWTEVLLAFVHGRQCAYEVWDDASRVIAKGGTLAVEGNELGPVNRTKCRVVWTGE